jgi:hypothetical protein
MQIFPNANRDFSPNIFMHVHFFPTWSAMLIHDIARLWAYFYPAKIARMFYQVCCREEG